MAKLETYKLDTENQEWQQALQIIQYTRRSLFLTGRAGTGKSTFLRHIAETTKKKYVILAPTGIAAINAGGQTLHSFFKLPFHPLLPNDSRYNIRNIRKTLKYSGVTTKLLRELELIIIDEISMVRADIIDFIDKVLRIYCRNMRHLPVRARGEGRRMAVDAAVLCLRLFLLGEGVAGDESGEHRTA